MEPPPPSQQPFVPAVPPRRDQPATRQLPIAEDRVIEPPDYRKQSTSLDMLQRGLRFVADGASVTPEFLQELQRMLSQWQARTDLAGVVMRHHAVSRFHKLASAIEHGESILFNPDQLLNLTPDQLIRVLTMMHAESHALRKMLDPGEPEPPPSAESILQSADPALMAARVSATADARGINLQMRQIVRDALNRFVATGLQAQQQQQGNHVQEKTAQANPHPAASGPTGKKATIRVVAKPAKPTKK